VSWFVVDSRAVEDACRGYERLGIVFILVGSAGVVFGMFWAAFAVLCLILGIGTGLVLGLVVGVGGLMPIAGGALVLGLGVLRRVWAARLRDLQTLAHGAGGVTHDQVAAIMGETSARKLLRKACEMGVAAPGVPARS
jgi:hypothetical protein